MPGKVEVGVADLSVPNTAAVLTFCTLTVNAAPCSCEPVGADDFLGVGLSHENWIPWKHANIPNIYFEILYRTTIEI